MINLLCLLISFDYLDLVHECTPSIDQDYLVDRLPVGIGGSLWASNSSLFAVALTRKSTVGIARVLQNASLQRQ